MSFTNWVFFSLFELCPLSFKLVMLFSVFYGGHRATQAVAFFFFGRYDSTWKRNENGIYHDSLLDYQLHYNRHLYWISGQFVQRPSLPRAILTL